MLLQVSGPSKGDFGSDSITCGTHNLTTTVNRLTFGNLGLFLFYFVVPIWLPSMASEERSKETELLVIQYSVYRPLSYIVAEAVDLTAEKQKQKPESIKLSKESNVAKQCAAGTPRSPSGEVVLEAAPP